MSYDSPGEGRTYLKNRWFQMLSISDERLQDVAGDVFDVLCHYYSAPDRAYHTLEHIWYLLKAQEEYFPDMSRAGILAIFWHDVIYFPGHPHNETLSASMMIHYMEGLVDEFHISVAAHIIEETKTHESPYSQTSCEVCDLDLMGLGGPAEAYDRNTDKIRFEFSRATDEQWIAGRKAFLLERLGRVGTIFHTAVMQDKFEHAARANMWRELDNLPEI